MVCPLCYILCLLGKRHIFCVIPVLCLMLFISSAKTNSYADLNFCYVYENFRFGMELMHSSSFGMFVWIGKLFNAHFASDFVVLLLSVFLYLCS